MTRIRNLFLLIAALLATASLHAQVSMGFRAGYQNAGVRFTDNLDALAPDFRSVDGYNIAAVAEIPLGNGFAFQPELSVSRKGFLLNEGTQLDLFNIPIPVDVGAESRFTYLEAPLLLKYKAGEGPVQAYFTAGPSIGYATAGRLITRANALLEIELLNTDIDLQSINYEQLELSAIAGVGLSVQAGSVQIFADARYQHGFTELYDIPLVNERIRNRSFGLNMGVLLPL